MLRFSQFINNGTYSNKTFSASLSYQNHTSVGHVFTSIHIYFQVPVNTALEGLCEGMLEAWKLYNDPKYV